jgi:hypothetical protein
MGFAAFLGTPAGAATISAGATLLSGFFGSRRRKREQRAAKAKYEEMKAAYEDLDTSNIYADVTNPYLGMENTMEDLTVNTQQADFQARQGAQARADILGRFRGTAGGSGVAALAQSLANQQTQQTAQISASIGAQEAANQRAAAMQAGRIQQLERGGELQAQQIRMGGEAQARALEYQKTSTMFGMGQQRLASANQAVAQGQARLASGIGGLAAAYATGQFGDMFNNAPGATITPTNSLGSGDINFKPPGELDIPINNNYNYMLPENNFYNPYSQNG